MIKVLTMKAVLKEAGGLPAVRACWTTGQAYGLMLQAQDRLVRAAFVAKRPASEVVELDGTLINDWLDNVRHDLPDLELVPGTRCWARTAGGGHIKVTIIDVLAGQGRAIVEDDLRHGRHTVTLGQLFAR